MCQEMQTPLCAPLCVGSSILHLLFLFILEAKMETCIVCGSHEVVQFVPVPLCLWHQTPPEETPVVYDNLPDLLAWEVEVEEYYPEWRY